MQLSLILENFPDNDPVGMSRIWINPLDRGLYFGKERVFLNYDDPDSIATIGDLDRELDKRNYFALETKFIDSSGDLVQNIAKGNIKYNKTSNKIEYRMSEVIDKDNKILGTTIKTYKPLEGGIYFNSDTSLFSIDFLEDNRKCKIVFPGDHIKEISLVELAKKFVIPGVTCSISYLEVSYAENEGSNYIDLVLHDDYTKSVIKDPIFSYKHFVDDNQYRRVYNTSLSDYSLEKGFKLDLTETGLLSLYYYPQDESSTVFDYFIKNCSVKFKYEL